MKLFEKIKSWFGEKCLRRQVKIYTHLRELAEALCSEGLAQWADQIDNAFYGLTSGEILDTQSFVLRNMAKQEKLSRAIKSKICGIKFEIWGLWDGKFTIATSEIAPSTESPPEPVKPKTESDAETIRNSEWAFLLRDGTRLSCCLEDMPQVPVKIKYEDDTIQAKIVPESPENTWRLSADTFTCVVAASGKLVSMDAYTPASCWIAVPELAVPETCGFYRVSFSADFDANGIAPLCCDSNKRIVWQYSDKNQLLRAIFEDRTEHFYAIAPNLIIGVRDTNMLSEVYFFGIMDHPTHRS